MKKIKLLYILLAFTLIVPSAYAYTPVGMALRAGTSTINTTDRFTTTGTQIIMNFPFDDPNNIYQWGKVQTIDAIGIKLATPSGAPNGDLKIRVYSYDTLYNYVLEEELTYTYAQLVLAQCTDGCDVHIFLSSTINVVSNKGYAIGVYSQSTGYPWYIYGNLNSKQFFNLPSLSSFNGLYTSVNYPNGTTPHYSDAFFSFDINYLDVFFYGIFLFPPTPTPPIEPPDNPLPCPECDENNSALPDSGTDEGDFSNPDFENSTGNCPQCMGNETRSVGNTIEVTSGFCAVLVSLGYGSSDGCNVKSFTDFLYDYSIIFFVLSLILLGYKIYLIGKWS